MLHTILSVKDLSISKWYLPSIYHQVKVITMSCCCSRAIDVILKPIDALFRAYLTIMKPVTCLRIKLLKWSLMSQVEQKHLTLPEFTPGFWMESCCSTSPIYGFWLPFGISKLFFSFSVFSIVICHYYVSFFFRSLLYMSVLASSNFFFFRYTAIHPLDDH